MKILTLSIRFSYSKKRASTIRRFISRHTWSGGSLGATQSTQVPQTLGPISPYQTRHFNPIRASMRFKNPNASNSTTSTRRMSEIPQLRQSVPRDRIATAPASSSQSPFIASALASTSNLNQSREEVPTPQAPNSPIVTSKEDLPEEPSRLALEDSVIIPDVEELAHVLEKPQCAIQAPLSPPITLPLPPLLATHLHHRTASDGSSYGEGESGRSSPPHLITTRINYSSGMAAGALIFQLEQSQQQRRRNFEVSGSNSIHHHHFPIIVTPFGMLDITPSPILRIIKVLILSFLIVPVHPSIKVCDLVRNLYISPFTF